MEQLKMVLNVKSFEYTIPEGYKIRSANITDAEAWFECCLNGLVPENPENGRKEFFQSFMLSDASVRIENILFLTDANDVPVATATAQLSCECDNVGYLHMVAVKTEYRGMGFSEVICAAVVERHNELGNNRCFLTTDDFRIPAIKTYLKLGWVPVASDSETKNRWRKVFDKIGIKYCDEIK